MSISTAVDVRRFTTAHARKITLLAPVFFVAHILEEAPGYVRWLNSLHPRGISQQGFLPANVLPFVITALLAAGVAYTQRRVGALVLLAWIANYMFANAIFHLTATLVLRRYSPGTVTAAVLYLPYFTWLVHDLRTRFQVWPVVLVAITLLGGLPWFVQGYLVVFKGDRF